MSVQLSSPYLPQYTCPEEFTPLAIRQVIRRFTLGITNFASCKANASIARKDRVIKSLTDTGRIITLSRDDPTLSPVGYLWKDLSDSPYIFGATKGIRSDHEPHFHNAWEVYYVLSGQGMTLAQDRFVPLTQGQFFLIPPNTIHNTPILADELSVLYWMPFNAHFSSITYYWRHSLPENDPAQALFDQVNAIRQRDLQLGPYGTNASFFASNT